MSKRSEQDALLVAAIGFVAVGVFMVAAIQSGLLPWAFLFGALAFTAMLVLSRDLKLASGVGGIVTVLITMIGVANVLSPGWHQNLL
ncbi:MAG: hypothetical protein OXE02_08230 [Chloroflexi bacterium]|nr:hypothetical protein [Chloroflexota bacterium]